MQISFGEKQTMVSGELTFEPSVFYVNLNSLTNWEHPNNEMISEEEKALIIKNLSEASGPTTIVFD